MLVGFFFWIRAQPCRIEVSWV